MDCDVRDEDVLDGFIGPRSPTNFLYVFIRNFGFIWEWNKPLLYIVGN
jgi:hypothetical protein